MSHLTALLTRSERVVAGLMSGTSLDGIDVVLARLKGSGPGMDVSVLGSAHVSYDAALRAALLANSAPETSSVDALSQLNARLGRCYAEAVDVALETAGLPRTALDLVGSHGQTVYHVPDPEPCAGMPTTSTLQIGDPSVTANLLGVPVVGDFRVADMALGGQGAPLVPYFDYVRFTDPAETRLLLNLGGIANMTLLPAGGRPGDVVAFDTGPSNMVIDLLTMYFYEEPYDAGGRHAARGRVNEALLARLLDDPFYAKPPPKSTGREAFGAPFAAALLDRAERLDAPDVLATATALTAETVHRAYRQFIAPIRPVDVVIASGGGTLNDTLMAGLAGRFAPVPVRTVADYGVDPATKEALCFAVLAHEYLNGVPTNLPSVTGATRPTLLGKLCLPFSQG